MRTDEVEMSNESAPADAKTWRFKIHDDGSASCIPLNDCKSYEAPELTIERVGTYVQKIIYKGKEYLPSEDI